MVTDNLSFFNQIKSNSLGLNIHGFQGMAFYQVFESKHPSM